MFGMQPSTRLLPSPDIVEPPSDIKLGEVLGSSEFIDEFGDERERVFVLDCHRVYVRGRSASSDVSSDISPSPLYIPPHRR